MDQDDVLTGSLMESSWLTLEQVAVACRVETAWLQAHVEEGFFQLDAASVAGVWRFNSTALARAKRMRQLERDFDAVPELAALFSDLIEELEAMRSRLQSQR